jgi:uroporphyrin-III C-methyltransferase
MSDSSNKQHARGFVSIVGAGPGDPELITVKGRSRIEVCDCLLYDYLVDERVLDWVKPGCQVICVGKRSGRHSMEQSAINALMVELAASRNHVVRLKGGDPFIFGRGGEEILALRARGLEFEIIPGVTAGVAAAASLALPLTHRERASTLMFVTGHEDPVKHRPRINWKDVVVTNSTLVIYMGMKHLPDIVAELLAAGKAPQTPVAVVEWVSTQRERQYRGVLAELPQQAAALGLAAPAIVIIGDVLAEPS